MSTPARSEIFHCFRCKKKLDVTHEVNNHVLRYSLSMGGQLMAELIGDIKTELVQAMKTNEYNCEECLGNEVKGG